jgi:hypothetical protein
MFGLRYSIFFLVFFFLSPSSIGKKKKESAQLFGRTILCSTLIFFKNKETMQSQVEQENDGQWDDSIDDIDDIDDTESPITQSSPLYSLRSLPISFPVKEPKKKAPKKRRGVDEKTPMPNNVEPFQIPETAIVMKGSSKLTLHSAVDKKKELDPRVIKIQKTLVECHRIYHKRQRKVGRMEKRKRRENAVMKEGEPPFKRRKRDELEKFYCNDCEYEMGILNVGPTCCCCKSVFCDDCAKKHYGAQTCSKCSNWSCKNPICQLYRTAESKTVKECEECNKPVCSVHREWKNKKDCCKGGC